MASCSNDETVIIWNIESTNPLQYLSGHTNVVECVKFANYNAVEIIKES